MRTEQRPRAERIEHRKDRAMMSFGMSDRHHIKVEDGFIHIVINGIIQAADISKLTEIGNRIAQEKHHYWILMDATGMTGFAMDARRRAALNPSGQNFQGAAVFGASLLAKTLITLVTRALLLLGQTHIRVQFVDSVEEGRQWIAEQRTRAAALRK